MHTFGLKLRDHAPSLERAAGCRFSAWEAMSATGIAIARR
jgi:hypothetical protein